jgi:dihydrofolate synthase / folylpolyglutamate synthase
MTPNDSAGYERVAQHLFALKARGRKFGIDRMAALADAIGHPERATPCIHISGTNGKGSVAAMLSAILRAAGWRTGLYTSPHLVHLGERVQVDGRPLQEQEIVDYVRELRPVAERLGAADEDDHPSFFEYMTAMAFLQFARQRCDIAVIEVGLGGRLDATNIVLPEVSVITSIGLDHCETLGRELPQIAGEKAGIIKAGRPVVIGRMPGVAERRIRDIARERGSRVVSVADEYGDDIARYPRTNLAGDYQRWNAATATLAARALPATWRITAQALATGLEQVWWPGRWQRLSVAGRSVIIDTSHNPEGAQVLDSNLARLVTEIGRAPIVIVGALGLERAQPLIEVICRHAGAIYFVVPKQPRACTHEQLEALVPRDYRGPVAGSTLEELFPSSGICMAGGPGDTVVVTGSVYLAGEVMGRLSIPAERAR